MARTEFSSLKVSDAALLDALEAIRKQVRPEKDGRFQVVVAEGVQGIEGTYEEVLDHSAVKEVLAAQSQVLRQAAVFLDNRFQVQVTRQEPLDRIGVSYQDNFDQAMVARLVAASRRWLRPYDQVEGIEKILGAELSEFYRRREAGLLRLEELAQSLIVQNEAYRRKVDDEVTAIRRRLDEEAKAEMQRLHSEYEAKDAALKGREEALDARAKALDDRSSRHARRQIRHDLKAALANRTRDFSLTKQTAAKRIPLHALFALLIAVPGLLFIRSFLELVASGTAPNWLLLTRIAVSGAALAAALVYYIRWNDQWFRQHSEGEFRLRRLDLDIDRASWVVETAFEWKEEKGTEIPPELIDRLTRNLFVADEVDRRGVRHPGEDLASALLGASSRLNVQIPGIGEATLDRKGVKQLKRKADEGAE
jgi:hypothetical protein